MKRLIPKKPKIVSKSSDKVKSALVQTAGTLSRVSKSPDEMMGGFFDDVQNRQVYDDGKKFVDMIPRKRARALVKEYKIESKDPDFDLNEFVNRHFYEFRPHKRNEYEPTDETTTREHVAQLWRGLKRRNRINRGSLVAIPYEYVVPGGRFS